MQTGGRSVRPQYVLLSSLWGRRGGGCGRRSCCTCHRPWPAWPWRLQLRASPWRLHGLHKSQGRPWRHSVLVAAARVKGGRRRAVGGAVPVGAVGREGGREAAQALAPLACGASAVFAKGGEGFEWMCIMKWNTLPCECAVCPGPRRGRAGGRAGGGLPGLGYALHVAEQPAEEHDDHGEGSRHAHHRAEEHCVAGLQQTKGARARARVEASNLGEMRRQSGGGGQALVHTAQQPCHATTQLFARSKHAAHGPRWTGEGAPASPRAVPTPLLTIMTSQNHFMRPAIFIIVAICSGVRSFILSVICAACSSVMPIPCAACARSAVWSFGRLVHVESGWGECATTRTRHRIRPGHSQ